MTVDLYRLITLHTLLISHNLFSFPNMKKYLAGKQNRTDDEVTSAVEDFFEDQDESFIPRVSKRCNTDGRSVWTAAGEAMLKNKPHLFIFDHCIIVSIWNFQPTLVLAVVCDYLCSWKVARLVAIKAHMPHGARTVDARSLVITCLDPLCDHFDRIVFFLHVQNLIFERTFNSMHLR